MRARLRAAEAALLEVEVAEPEVVAQLARLDAAQRELRNLHSGIETGRRSRRGALVRVRVRG